MSRLIYLYDQSPYEKTNIISLQKLTSETSLQKLTSETSLQKLTSETSVSILSFLRCRIYIFITKLYHYKKTDFVERQKLKCLEKNRWSQMEINKSQPHASPIIRTQSKRSTKRFPFVPVAVAKRNSSSKCSISKST